MSLTRRKVLVICRGNHCRSPIAALVIAERAGGTLDVRSAGTRDWHVGKPAHPLMVQAAAGFGYDLTEHRGAFLDRELLDWADDLLVVDEETAATVQALVDPDRPVRILGEGIVDPWGGELPDFARAVSEIQDATRLFYAT
ncbi:low molecular weight phosphotyrosine protein phosphatase [Kitasatospora purpeofusca]|uniref:arsenate reductase/protein-tyrosine-phosphatase family protein n=1 Tax=Kitasatospora purpeofusca TaxID=67352 RepID=UPI002A5AACD0|nr:low molecular weight phosphotyrosine protein phosphatase [Kitasatospora purpeofusca]MDY0810724.1 low molecular weight phosphotyrosine protein phosphatase [Kitasatospora purpeofusca]